MKFYVKMLKKLKFIEEKFIIAILDNTKMAIIIP